MLFILEVKANDSDTIAACTVISFHVHLLQGLWIDSTALGCEQATMKLRPQQKQALVPLAAEYLQVTHRVAAERREIAAALIKVGGQNSNQVPSMAND